MPLYRFFCESCAKNVNRILPSDPGDSKINCKVCDTYLIRTPTPPTTQMTDVLDNGIMSKRLERLTNAEQLFKERSMEKKDD